MPSAAGYNFADQLGVAVTQAFGTKLTPEKRRFFNAWTRAEGTEARYNPLATTRKGYAGETQFNPVGVKNYPDLQTGLRATVDTLKLDYYKDLTALIRRNDVSAEQLAKAVAASPWGTGTGVLRVLGSTAVDGYEQQTRTAKLGANQGAIKQHHLVNQAVISANAGGSRFAPSAGYMAGLQRMGKAGAQGLRLAQGFRPMGPPAGAQAPGGNFVPDEQAQQESGAPFQPQGGTFVLPQTWKPTHNTDGYDELTGGGTTAIDLMQKANTPVGAPSSGRIVQLGSAQGGESLHFQADNGDYYWIGHVHQSLKPGTHVKRGQVITYVSPDHPAPHVHLDKRPGGRRR